MAAILYSAILNSAILDSAIFLKTLIHSPTNSIWLKVIHSDSTWWWQPSWILPFFTKINFTHSWLNLDDGSHWILPFFHILHKKTFTHSFWLNLMMAAILNSAMFNLASLDSAILVFPLKLIHIAKIGSHICIKKLYSFILSTWWWQQS